MATQAWLIFTSEQNDDVLVINATSPNAQVVPRVIDNPLANNLGEGTLLGKYVAPARLLNDPEYTAFVAVCSPLPIRAMDSDVLFLPDVAP